MRVRRRTLALALPVALILGLGACSSDGVAPTTSSAAPTSEAPSETPTDEPVETPEPKPTETGPTPPARPAAMDDTGKKGAQAAAEYFIAVLNYGLASGDSEPLVDIRFTGMCVTCGNLADRIDSYADENYIVDGGSGSLSSFDVSDRDSLTGGYAVFAKFETEKMTVTDADGRQIDNFEYDDGNVQIDVVHDGETWKVMSMVTDQGRAN